MATPIHCKSWLRVTAAVLLILSSTHAQFVDQPIGTQEFLAIQRANFSCKVEDGYTVDWEVIFPDSMMPIQAARTVFSSIFIDRDFTFTGVVTNTSTISFGIFDAAGNETNNATSIRCVAEDINGRVLGDSVQVIFREVKLETTSTPTAGVSTAGATTIASEGITTTTNNNTVLVAVAVVSIIIILLLAVAVVVVATLFYRCKKKKHVCKMNEQEYDHQGPETELKLTEQETDGELVETRAPNPRLDNIIEGFKSYVDHVQNIVETEEARCPGRFRNVLLDLFQNYDDDDDLLENTTSTVHELFDTLKSRHSFFLEYKVFEDILNVYDKQNNGSYLQDLTKYLEEEVKFESGKHVLYLSSYSGERVKNVPAVKEAIAVLLKSDPVEIHVQSMMAVLPATYGK